MLADLDERERIRSILDTRRHRVIAGEHVVYHAPVFGPAIETTPTANGEFSDQRLYAQHFGDRRWA